MLFLTLCAAGFCIYGPQALIGIAAANQATKKAAATANGLTGLFGYASTVVSGVGLGFVAQHYGWNWAYVGIIGVAIVGMLVFLMMWGRVPTVTMPNRNGIKQYVPILDDDTGLAIRECPNRSAVSDTFLIKAKNNYICSNNC